MTLFKITELESDCLIFHLDVCVTRFKRTSIKHVERVCFVQENKLASYVIVVLGYPISVP